MMGADVQAGGDGGVREVAPDPQAMLEALLQCGAEPRLLTLPWVANGMRWVVWKLASLAQRRPEIRHQLLSWEVALDEMKKR